MIKKALECLASAPAGNIPWKCRCLNCELWQSGWEWLQFDCGLWGYAEWRRECFGPHCSLSVLKRELIKKDGDQLFTWSDNDRTRGGGGGGAKPKEGRFRLDVRRKFFTERVTFHWHCCPEKCGCPIPGDERGQAG